MDHLITFAAHRNDGSLKHHIKRAFLRNMMLNADDLARGTIKLEDDTEWLLVYDSYQLAQKLEDYEVQCIISFQAWTTGQHFAVAREFKGD